MLVHAVDRDFINDPPVARHGNRFKPGAKGASPGELLRFFALFVLLTHRFIQHQLYAYALTPAARHRQRGGLADAVQRQQAALNVIE